MGSGPFLRERRWCLLVAVQQRRTLAPNAPGSCEMDDESVYLNNTSRNTSRCGNNPGTGDPGCRAERPGIDRIDR